MPIQPSPSADTLRLCLPEPSVRYFVCAAGPVDEPFADVWAETMFKAGDAKSDAPKVVPAFKKDLLS